MNEYFNKAFTLLKETSNVTNCPYFYITYLNTSLNPPARKVGRSMGEKISVKMHRYSTAVPLNFVPYIIVFVNSINDNNNDEDDFIDSIANNKRIGDKELVKKIDDTLIAKLVVDYIDANARKKGTTYINGIYYKDNMYSADEFKKLVNGDNSAKPKKILNKYKFVVNENDEIHCLAHMLDEAFNKEMLTEGKHWPKDYIKTAFNLIKLSSLGLQSWYSDTFILQDVKTFVDEFGPLSHKNSNLGFFSTIVKWFILYSGTSKEKYQEFIERKLDGIIGALQTILNDSAYDKIKDEIKQKWTFEQFEELQKKIADEAKASSDEKLKSIIARDDYEVIPIYSYEELYEKFGGDWTGWHGLSEWCHTNGRSTYESWTKEGTQMFFVLAKKSWQKVFLPEHKPTGKDYNAYDEYGLSLIAILVDVASGNLLNETLRWNHVIEPSYTNPGASVDKAFKSNWGELSLIVGMDVKSEVAKMIKGKQDELKKIVDNANVEVAKILKNAKIITAVTIPKEYRQYVTKIDIPDGVASIGANVFYNYTNLTSVTIPDSVLSIGRQAFYSCSKLTSVKIPDGVTSIGDWAFSYCSGLTSITIPDSVTSIGASAFYGCYRLTSMTIPDSVTSIGEFAFAYCYELTSVTIPNSVDSIEMDTFLNCYELKSVTILDGVTRIRSYAFKGCSSLTSLTIPNSITSIGRLIFIGCTSLKELIFKGKTIEELESMKNYPFGIEDESIIEAKKTLDENVGEMM